MTPPGWYADPADPRVLRWWDGTTWTAHTQPAPQPHGPTPVHSGPTTPDGEPLGGWWWRALALLIDSAALAVLGAIASLPTQIAVQRELAPLQEEFNRRVAVGEPAAFGDFFRATTEVYADHVVGLLLVPLLVGIAYHAAFLRWKGATPGKLACGLRVRPVAAPGRLSWSAILLRVGTQTVLPAAGYALAFSSGSIAAFLLGSLAVLAYYATDALWATRAPRRTLHDLAAGTVVVSTRR